MNIEELKDEAIISKMPDSNKYLDLYITYPKYLYGIEPDITPNFIVTNKKGIIKHTTKSYQNALMFMLLINSRKEKIK